MLDSRQIVVLAHGTPTNSRQVRGGHSWGAAPALFSRQHLVYRHGRQQASTSLKDDEINQHHDQLSPAIRQPCQQQGEGMQLPHSSPSPHVQPVKKEAVQTTGP